MAIGMHTERAVGLQEQGLPLSHRNLAYRTPRDTPAKVARPVGGIVNAYQHVVTKRVTHPTGRIGVDAKAVLQAARLAKLFPSAFSREALEPAAPVALNTASSVGQVVTDDGVAYVVVWDGI